MPSKVFSAAIVGIDAQLIEVETDVSRGLRCFDIIGLPDQTVKEAKQRVNSAIKSAGFQPPSSKPQRVLVNLAPANLKKQGSLYDLSIAIGYLLASKQIIFWAQDKIFIGEISLDGNLRPVKGVLSITIEAKKRGFKEIILPQENGLEASIIKGISVIPVRSLNNVINYLKGKLKVPVLSISKKTSILKDEDMVDISWINGQEYAKRSLEIVAAGRHNLLMIGPPGTGKTLLAKSIQSIIPDLSFKESIEVTKIYSVKGLVPENTFLVTRPPFRSPHHTASKVAIIGGGNPPVPGEITLAHRGVLFLDEFPEFHRDTLESLRQPLESGNVSIFRSKYRSIFPSKFTLVAAANPCPCGYYKNPERKCVCTPSQIQKYRRKFSGPLIDRIDIFISVPQVKYEKLIKQNKKDETVLIKKRVENAYKIQEQRFEKENIFTNSEMEIPQIKKYCIVPPGSQSILRKYVDSSRLSIRGFHRILKLSRTIADLEGSEKILDRHISEALMYRLNSLL